MKELIGKRVRITLNLPDTKWPIPGFPAWADVEKVDMPMIKFHDYGWINTAIIQSISEAGPATYLAYQSEAGPTGGNNGKI